MADGRDHGVALVTGASRGLGAAIARRLGQDGWAVAVNYRSDEAGARQVVADVLSAGGHARAFGADVTDEDGVAGLVREVRRELGDVVVLVLNATGPQPNVPLEELEWSHHLDQLRFFVKSPTLLVRALAPRMRERGHGRIIQIGSDEFDRASAGMSAYVAAKGAQIGLTRTWARELGRSGITVNLVVPGWIPVERHAGTPEASLSGYREQVPLGRLGRPEEVAAAVAWLASPDAAFVTGERIRVNGGLTRG